jgi:hypothetical protein
MPEQEARLPLVYSEFKDFRIQNRMPEQEARLPLVYPEFKDFRIQNRMPEQEARAGPVGLTLLLRASCSSERRCGSDRTAALARARARRGGCALRGRRASQALCPRGAACAPSGASAR